MTSVSQTGPRLTSSGGRAPLTISAQSPSYTWADDVARDAFHPLNEQRQLAFELVMAPAIVRIHRRDERPSGLRHAPVSRGADTAIVLSQDAHSLPERPCDVA